MVVLLTELLERPSYIFLYPLDMFSIWDFRVGLSDSNPTDLPCSDIYFDT